MVLMGYCDACRGLPSHTNPLIACASCPRRFHAACAGVDAAQAAPWSCDSCAPPPTPPPTPPPVAVVDLSDGSGVAAHAPALAAALLGVGAVQLILPPALAALNARAFELWAEFLAKPEAYKAAFAIAEGAVADGYHARGAVAPYYNAHRSGVIYEGDALAPLLAGVDFEARVAEWRDACRALAAAVLDAVAGERGAPREPFAAGGAFDARRGGQFHVKRTHCAAADGAVLLPPHRDPSLLSMVNHVAPSPVAPGGAGLEIYGGGRYRPIAVAGVGVCTILAGSLLASVLPGVVSPKHRIVATFDADTPRLAATFFFQPRDDARICDLRAPEKARRGAPTYAQWRKKAYGRYYKATQSRLAKLESRGEPRSQSR